MQSALLIATALAAYLGFALLALGQARPWQRVAQTLPPTGLRLLALRTLGGLALTLSLGLALLRDGPSFGALLWATAITLAALAVAFTLTWRPKWLRPLAVIAAVGRSARCNTRETEGPRTAKVPPSNPARL
ncbi:DUF3325 family protein [Algihabitans sp.]|uniref:DUF3325 family protein n=1 Tax=Algihabitans sp. TaxID=2821514 RepID=UPI003BAB889C